MNDRPFIARIGPALRRRGQRLGGLARYFTGAFVRDPGLEIYSYAKSRQNRRVLLGLKAEQAKGADPRFDMFGGGRIPRVIWIYWAQGIEAAPPLVRRCVESWRRHNPGWDIRLLDAAGAAALVDLSDIPANMPQRVFANALRLRLLARHGGVWTDATVLCHRPLDGWLPLHALSGFFAFRDPGPDRRVASWFLAAEPGSPPAVAWEGTYGDYIAGSREKSGKYFMMMYSFGWAMLRDPAARAVWEQTGALPAIPTFLMMSVIEGRTPSDRLTALIGAGLPMSKLSRKVPVADAVFDRVIDLATAAETGTGPGPS